MDKAALWIRRAGPPIVACALTCLPGKSALACSPIEVTLLATESTTSDVEFAGDWVQDLIVASHWHYFRPADLLTDATYEASFFEFEYDLITGAPAQTEEVDWEWRASLVTSIGGTTEVYLDREALMTVQNVFGVTEHTPSTHSVVFTAQEDFESLQEIGISGHIDSELEWIDSRHEFSISETMTHHFCIAEDDPFLTETAPFIDNLRVLGSSSATIRSLLKAKSQATQRKRLNVRTSGGTGGGVRGSLDAIGQEIQTASPGFVVYDVTLPGNGAFHVPFAFLENGSQATLSFYLDDEIVASVSGEDYEEGLLDTILLDASGAPGPVAELRIQVDPTGTDPVRLFVPESLAVGEEAVEAAPVPGLASMTGRLVATLLSVVAGGMAVRSREARS
ncbi:MAG: hypothetical protein R3F35_15310 [Myxococcota bacterium]